MVDSLSWCKNKTPLKGLDDFKSHVSERLTNVGFRITNIHFYAMSKHCD